MAWRQALTKDAAISFQGEDSGVGSVPDTTAYYEEQERELDSDLEEEDEYMDAGVFRQAASRDRAHSTAPGKIGGTSSARPPGEKDEPVPEKLGNRGKGTARSSVTSAAPSSTSTDLAKLVAAHKVSPLRYFPPPGSTTDPQVCGMKPDPPFAGEFICTGARRIPV